MKLDNIIQRIEAASERIAYAENNLQYIKALRSAFFWLTRFADSLTPDEACQCAEYEAYFMTGCGFSFYDRVHNSILEYEYGNRPF